MVKRDLTSAALFRLLFSRYSSRPARRHLPAIAGARRRDIQNHTMHTSAAAFRKYLQCQQRASGMSQCKDEHGGFSKCQTYAVNTGGRNTTPRNSEHKPADQILTGNVWKQISARAEKAATRVGAIAYISTANHLSFREGDVLICDASDSAIRTGETSATVLDELSRAGVRLYSRPNLHAKLLVFGDCVLVGSCNLSEPSASALYEAALLTARTSIRSQALAFIRRNRDASTLIDPSFVSRILKIKVVRRGRAKVIRGRHDEDRFGHRTWIVRTYNFDMDRHPGEQIWVDKAENETKQLLSHADNELGWVRWVGKSRFREVARKGDTLIILNSARGGKQITVSSPVAILKKQNHSNWTRFYHEIRPNDNVISWTNFNRALKRLDITSIKRNSTRELSKREESLMENLWE